MQDVRLIQLPKGETLELTILPGFLAKVCQHFGLASEKDVTDDHLRMFVWGSFKNAVDKEEASG